MQALMPLLPLLRASTCLILDSPSFGYKNKNNTQSGV